ncbi:hypothetical protein [Rhodococcus sp. RDE2]|uniref:hypothetical protein n=1 Tax=Rhodococcus sp. RDE2 TaxID=2885078 RepID=UPI001E2A83DA|nr:hypothetical protein [Rhodococcus sp. RDE2]BDB63254.1 hypothetical protein RDE2_50480 [Rhodococcus sp. RDE2]
MAETTTERRDRIVEIYHDDTAHVVAYAGVAYHLTPCCDASAKGSLGSIVCRSCYQEVCPMYGMGWALTDDKDWARFRAYMLAEYPASAQSLDERRALAL